MSLYDETIQHHSRCDLYRWCVDIMFPDFLQGKKFGEILWHSVCAFSQHDLKSITFGDMSSGILSSGSGGVMSKKYLDQLNDKVLLQAKLIEILGNTFSKKRYRN